MMATRAARPTAGETNCFQQMTNSWLKYERCTSPE